MNSPFIVADKQGNRCALPRIPTAEAVMRCCKYIAWVDTHGTREKMPTRYGARKTFTRKQTWERTAYGLKHDVEGWSPVTKGYGEYQGYVMTEEFILAAVLCGITIKNLRCGEGFVDCMFEVKKGVES